jgi:nitrite reductase/ring-hydroxylating ferredoxin subunit
VGASGYLGGHLSYSKGVGVDNTVFEPVPKDFTAACPESSLGDGIPTRVDVGGAPVFLLRRGTEIVALAETCTHRGGPLSKGHLAEGCIECPWHGSRFELRTGEIARGPATAPQRRYEVRVEDGTVMVRVAPRPVVAGRGVLGGGPG